jgi:hypothetical protein
MSTDWKRLQDLLEWCSRPAEARMEAQAWAREREALVRETPPAKVLERMIPITEKRRMTE